MRIQTPKLWLPRTGQTTSYAAGDDGDFQAGNPRGVSGGAIQDTRFIDNLNGTISDRATGLTWIKTPELIIPGCPAAGYTRSGEQVWQVQRAGNDEVADWATSQAFLAGDVVRDAAGSQSTACIISAATAANPCVLTVDNIQGLTTGDLVLVNSIVGNMGTTLLNGNYYYVSVNSSTKKLTLYTDAYLVTGVNATGKTYTSGGTATQCKFYVCILDHTSDTFATDIAFPRWALSVWTASAANLTTPRMMDWTAAVSLSLMTYAGFTDWRLPNAMELFSLYDFGQASDTAAINDAFYDTLYNTANKSRYWTSTTCAISTTYAAGVSFMAAITSAVRIVFLLKTGAYPVRHVRGGRING
jgi:hypothetical protein